MQNYIIIYANFLLLVIILLEMGNFGLPLTLGGYKIAFAWKNRSGYKTILKKKNLMSIKNPWETKLSKISQKILILDLPILHFSICNCNKETFTILNPFFVDH